MSDKVAQEEIEKLKELDKEEEREKQPEKKVKAEITLACPQCGEEIIVHNVISTNDYETKNPKASFYLAFKQIFYDVVCASCEVRCLPKEENKDG